MAELVKVEKGLGVALENKRVGSNPQSNACVVNSEAANRRRMHKHVASKFLVQLTPAQGAPRMLEKPAVVRRVKEDQKVKDNVKADDENV